MQFVGYPLLVGIEVLLLPSELFQHLGLFVILEVLGVLTSLCAPLLLSYFWRAVVVVVFIVFLNDLYFLALDFELLDKAFDVIFNDLTALGLLHGLLHGSNGFAHLLASGPLRLQLGEEGPQLFDLLFILLKQGVLGVLVNARLVLD